MAGAAETFGRILREMRRVRGMSQEELAERANLSVNAISAFERGERFPRASTVDALAAALQTEADVLLGDLLVVRERASPSYGRGAGATPGSSALRELAELLRGKPEPLVRMVLDVARRIVMEFPPPPPETPEE